MKTFYTSAPIAYDGFSTRTLATVGLDRINGEPVRKVECEERDYDWQTGRYGSGMHRYTNERISLEAYVKYGDWTVDTDYETDATPESESNRRYGALNERFDERATQLLGMGFKYQRIKEYDIAVFVRPRPGKTVPTSIQAAFVAHADDYFWEDKIRDVQA